MKDDCVVLFSGGTDSTLAAAQMLQEFQKVTLLTFQPGYLFFIDNTRVHARKLAAFYGEDRVSHHIIDIKSEIAEILGGAPGFDVKKYGFNLTALVCLGCRLTMHACALTWCMENNIPYIADGSIRGQSSVPEQMESVIRRNREFYSRAYGIQHFSPIYEEGESDNRLVELGITNKKRLKRQFILFDTQATCAFGVPADVYGKLFYGGMVGSQRERDSEHYCQEKYPLMQTYIQAYFDKKGLNVDELVERNRKKRQADGHINIPTLSALGDEQAST